MEPGRPEDVSLEGYESSDSESVYEMEGNQLLESLEKLGERTYRELFRVRDARVWEEAERDLQGVRTGRAARTVREQSQKAREREKEAILLRTSTEAEMFRAYFTKPAPQRPVVLSSVTLQEKLATAVAEARRASDDVFRRKQLVGASG
ncbi:hypothetical protein K466DRAFT_483505, partial [Polyporus arcularius HHB13444]